MLSPYHLRQPSLDRDHGGPALKSVVQDFVGVQFLGDGGLGEGVEGGVAEQVGAGMVRGEAAGDALVVLAADTDAFVLLDLGHGADEGRAAPGVGDGFAVAGEQGRREEVDAGGEHEVAGLDVEVEAGALHFFAGAFPEEDAVL